MERIYGRCYVIKICMVSSSQAQFKELVRKRGAKTGGKKLSKILEDKNRQNDGTKTDKIKNQIFLQ
jgi:hypothetical protein